MRAAPAVDHTDEPRRHGIADRPTVSGLCGTVNAATVIRVFRVIRGSPSLSGVIPRMSTPLATHDYSPAGLAAALEFLKRTRSEVDQEIGFYGFKENPFSLSPDPRFMYLSFQHTKALKRAQRNIDSRQGLTLILGDAGVSDDANDPAVDLFLVPAKQRLEGFQVPGREAFQKFHAPLSIGSTA